MTATVKTTSLFDTVFELEPTLPDDLKKHRHGDSHRLLKRLDCVYKHAAVVDRHTPWTDDQIVWYLEKLVTIYLDTADSIKISRAVEKLWQLYINKYGHVINEVLERMVQSLINTTGIDSIQITRVSVLFEQSKQVQGVFKKNLQRVVQWLLTELCPLLELPPYKLTPAQSQCVHALVKMCLQMSQVCQHDIGAGIWLKESQADLNTGVASIVKCLMHILLVEGYHIDCVLLCGTAMTLLLNTCPVYNQSDVFLTLLGHTLSKEHAFDVHTLQDCKLDTGIDTERILELLNEVTIKHMGAIALLRGVVACGSTEALLSKCTADLPSDSVSPLLAKQKESSSEKSENQCETPSPLIFRLYPYIYTLCRGDLTVHYHAFQILHLWYTRVIKLGPASSLNTSANDNKLASFVKSSWKLVNLNWDSPVEDVSETVVDIFTCMMNVWECIKREMPEFAAGIFTVLQDTPWFVKGKYKILAVLIKYVHIDQVVGDGGCTFQDQLLHCLTTNHLASSATQLYKAVLTKLGKTEESLQSWRSAWLPTLVRGLTCDNSILRYNTSLHWVPVTLKLLPLSADVIQTRLSCLLATPTSSDNRLTVLHAWVIVAKSVRSLTAHADLRNEHVRAALYSDNEDLRSDAISLVCNTLKKAECLSEVESSLLMESLPYNVKIDSAPFRQHLGSDVRKLLVRLRDSCIPLVNTPDKHGTKLDCALKFVDWLHGMCIEYLLPGACYQRRKGSLDLLHVIYETLVYSAENKQRKGFVPETAVKLMMYAQSTDRWHFFSPASTHTLLLCILDGTQEIQSSAFQLLVKYYPWPMQSHVETPDAMCCHLLSEALRLCSSPKGHESDSGAILCKLVFQKYVMGKQTTFNIKHEPQGSKYHVTLCDTVTLSNHGNSAVQFLQLLLSQIHTCMAEADKDLVAASKHFPIYGLISAVTKCLTETEDISRQLDTQFLPTMEALIDQCRNIIHQMLSIMSGVGGKEACPSFAEIGMALENLLLESETDYTESTSISPEYQYMLSWCWNNIKESCTSLGEITHTTVRSNLPLPVHVIHGMKDTFITVLTKCRHKGVIEGCRSAFVRFCCALFTSNDATLLQIPAHILTEVLLSLKRKEMVSSVTRRSAGLPIIILSILVSEKHTKKTVLLSEAVSCLFEICKLPLDSDLGLTDLPQVHGLNILNSLLSDASLAGCLIGHTSHVTMMVIEQFGSPSWGVRMAATRLFSTLVTKIFGQKKSQHGHFCNSVTFQELQSYYPELPAFMLNILQEAAQRDVSNICEIHPGLFPVLTLLACLKPTDTQDPATTRQLTLLFNTIKVFAGSPVYQLRHLVAPACVAMVTVTDMMSSVISCIDSDITDTPGNSNSVHGHLLFVSSLIDCLKRDEDTLRICEKFVEKRWLMAHNTGIIPGLYVHILHKLLEKNSSIQVDPDITAQLLQNCTLEAQSVGCGMLSEACLKFLYTIYQSRGQGGMDLTASLLQSPTLEVRKACLDHLLVQVNKREAWIHKMKLLSAIAMLFTKETYLQNQFTILELISSLYSEIMELGQHDLDLAKGDTKRGYGDLKNQCDIRLSKDNLELGNGDLQNQYGLDLCKDDLEMLAVCVSCVDEGLWNYRSRSSLLLVIRAICLVHGLHTARDTGEADMFCRLLWDCCQATNETERMSAVRALQIAGASLLKADNGHIQVSIIDSCVTLVQDEDVDIRAEACKFISSLLKSKGIIQFDSAHSNVCFELFLQYISKHMWQSPEVIQYLCDQLTGMGDLQCVLKERSSSRYAQLFDQEDNSFFAEKIYNSFTIHQCLLAIVEKCETGGVWTSLQSLQQPDTPTSLCISLVLLQDTLASIEQGSVINILCDNKVLASVVGLLLYSDVIAQSVSGHLELDICSQPETSNIHRQQLQTHITAIVQNRRLPPVLQKKMEMLPSVLHHQHT